MNLIARMAIPCLLASAAWAGPAMAADYDPPLVIDAPEVADEFVPVEVGTGWYLRGDVGYVIKSRAGSINYRTFDGTVPPGTYSNSSFTSANLGTDFTWGGGFGYQFNQWLRTDATVEGYRASFNGRTAGAAPCDPVDPAYAGTTCRSEDGSSFSAIGIMANGYADLGTFAGITPYVGGGLGYSLLRWDNMNNTTYCVDDVNPCPASTPVATTSHQGYDSWRFTYALMAGVAYDVTKNVKIDLGYKYRHIQGGSMFGWDAGSAAAGATGVQGRDSGFSTHEVRLGFRYALW